MIRWILAAVHLLADAANATSLATTSFIQAALVLFMVLAATAMARGYGVTN